MSSQAATSVSDEFRNIVEGHAERWRHTEGEPESTLLRLSILRDIVRLLHAQKSNFLASGRRDLTLQLRTWENRLHELRNHSSLDGDLIQLVTGTDAIRKRTRLLPEALYTSIEKEKLERYDRQWETAIAAEAASLGWRFWSLEAWVEITLVEEWNNKLNDQMWPAGIVLFVESSPNHAAQKGATPTTSLEFPLWRGRWIAVIHPRFKTPAEIALNLHQWPGTPFDPPSPAQWKLLFSPKVN